MSSDKPITHGTVVQKLHLCLQRQVDIARSQYQRSLTLAGRGVEQSESTENYAMAVLLAEEKLLRFQLEHYDQI